ncbi:MAG: hypothetical protein M3Z24_10520 [Chloroflexota bacterium]|nr:hypothetical protein [Chloroflexota bacterium]
MTNKPNLVRSLITLAVACIISVISAWLWRPRRGTVSVKEVTQSHRAQGKTIKGR